MDGSNQPQQPFQPTPQGPAPQPMPPQPMQPVQPMPPQPPFGGPVNPMNPMGPVGPAPMGAPYQMPPKKGLSKGALWGIIGGSIALILLIVGVIMAVLLLSGPSREDYVAFQSQVKDLKKQRQNMKDALLPHARAIFGGKASDGSLKRALEAYDKHGSQLKEMKALRDPEVKKSYDEFVKEFEETKTYVRGFVDVEETAITAYKKCDGKSLSDVARITDFRAKIVALRSSAQECADAINALSESKVESITQYVDRAKKAYDDQIAIFNEMIKAIDSGDRAKLQAASGRLQTQSRDFLRATGGLLGIFADAEKYDEMPKLEALDSVVAEKLNK
ncbi:MAG: hypothetical protein Q4A37_02545 [Candidatus Saccharibacteria bacterium]|nr:hypothetical protein [Candidatus Saccharibacteria bacterium]